MAPYKYRLFYLISGMRNISIAHILFQDDCRSVYYVKVYEGTSYLTTLDLW